MSEISSRRRPGVKFAGAVVSVAALVVGLAPSAAADELQEVPGSVPAWAVSGNDVGAAAADESVEGELYLDLRDQAGAERLATEVSTPGSGRYGSYVRPDDWISRFSPTKADFEAKLSYLRSKGLTITGTPRSRLFIVFRGTPGAVGAAFGTALHTYRVDGVRLVGPVSASKLPVRVGRGVTALSLDQGRLRTRPRSVRREQATSPVSRASRSPSSSATTNVPCSSYYGQYRGAVPLAYGRRSFPSDICGYVPADLRSGYGAEPLVAKGVAGQGQTVGIIDAYASPTIVSDVDAYSARRGEPALTTYRQRVPDPSAFTDADVCGGLSGWQGEQTLDVEAVHGFAPAANVLYVGGVNCGGGIDLALSTILDERLTSLVSNSYGYVGEDVPEEVIDGVVHQHLQAAAEGVGLYYSSGDDGDASAQLGRAQATFAASSPWVVAVGGTSLGLDRRGRVALETGWGTALTTIEDNPGGAPTYTRRPPGDFVFGAGGGRSTVFRQPTYQRGVVPPALAQGRRVSPDVSAVGDPFTGYLIGVSTIDDTTSTPGPYEEYAIGGTSLSTPLVAAQAALAQQASGVTIGFANPLLYGVYRRLPTLFRDVVPQSPPEALTYVGSTGTYYLVSLDRDTSLRTRKGYDEVTGLGGVDFARLMAEAH